jgi:hypothetical protein
MSGCNRAPSTWSKVRLRHPARVRRRSLAQGRTSPGLRAGPERPSAGRVTVPASAPILQLRAASARFISRIRGIPMRPASTPASVKDLPMQPKLRPVITVLTPLCVAFTSMVNAGARRRPTSFRCSFLDNEAPPWPPPALRGRRRRTGREHKGAGGPVGGNTSDDANICVVRTNRGYDRTLGAMLFDVGGVPLDWDPPTATASSYRTT